MCRGHARASRAAERSVTSSSGGKALSASSAIASVSRAVAATRGAAPERLGSLAAKAA
jgi:hypothetical protein